MSGAQGGGWPIRGVVLAALCALGLGGGAPGTVAIVALGAALLPPPPLPAGAWPPAHGAVLLATALLLLQGGTIAAFSILSSWLLVHQRWTVRSGEPTRVTLLLATLVLLLGCVQSESPWLAPCFVVYTALLPVALLRAQLAGRSPSRALEVSLSAGTALAGAALFVALPRLDGGYVSGGGSRSRMPDTVELGAEGVGNDDLTEVMRVRVTGPDGRTLPGPFYVRGRALDAFDGVRWRSSTPPGPTGPSAWNRRAEIRTRELGGPVLFSVGEPRRFEGVSVRRAGNQTFEHRVPGFSMTYVALGWDAGAAGGPAAVSGVGVPEAYLSLPELDPRVRSYAWTIEGSASDPGVVTTALARHLSTTFTYDPAPPAPTGDPLAEFLLERRSGHCEYFASALAVLLRVRGIPARVATGFHSGELADDGSVLVRRGHAHAWTEVPTADGWIAIDATPADGLPSPDGGGLGGWLGGVAGSWYRNVVDYDLNAQLVAYGRIGAPFVGALGGAQSPLGTGLTGMVVVAAGVFVAMALVRVALLVAASGGDALRRRSDPGARWMAQARAAVRARGWELPEALPPVEAAEWLATRVGPPAEAFRDLAHHVYAARYAGAPLDAAHARACLRALRGLPRRA